MSELYDVGVIGVGAMGAGAVWNLQREGLKVIGWERFDIPHTYGSSHGNSRIIRLAYFEGDEYVPFVKRSFELWKKLEQESGKRLLYTTGGLDIGGPDSTLFKNSLQTCKVQNIPHQVLTGDQVNARFPGFNIPSHFKAVYQKDSGFLDPETCISTLVSESVNKGATVKAREPVLHWEWIPAAGSGHFNVTTSKGSYSVKKLVICAGAWANSASQNELKTPVVPERQVLGFFGPKPGKEVNYEKEQFPIFILEHDTKEYYGFPMFKIPGVKVGLFGHFGENIDPDTYVNGGKEPRLDDETALKGFCAKFLPDALGDTLSMVPCMFCNSVDGHFIIDKLEQNPNIVVAAGFSGHGFKFCISVGEMITDLVQNRRTSPSSIATKSMFSLSRFSETTEKRQPPAKFFHTRGKL